MAIFGPFPAARTRVDHDRRFAEALHYVDELLQPGSSARQRIEAVTVGGTERVDLGGGSFALEQAYLTRTRAESFFESHRRFIDVQVVVDGAEVIEVEDIGRLPVAVAYDAERDLLKYGDAQTASRLALRAGDAAIFFPADGHMPMLQFAGRPLLVRKSVVKIPVGEK